MKRTKILFFLPLASLMLSSCSLSDFSFEKLMFWKKKDNQETQQKEEKNENDQQNGQNQNQGDNQQGGNEGGNQQGGNEGGNEGGGNQGGNEGGGQQGGGGSQTAAEGATIDFSVCQETAATVGAYSFTTAAGTNSNNQAPQWNANKNELRLYIGNTLTITSTGLITSIEFDANTCGETKADGTLTANPDSLTKFSWTGSANSVTFTVNSGKQVHINKINLNGGGEGGTTVDLLDEFPLEEVQAALQGGTIETFPIPEGEGFEFELDNDPDYPYSCYVTVHGGDMDAYLAALEKANFTIDDSYLDISGMYFAAAPGKTLMISLEESEDAYVLNFYAVEPIPTSDSFPEDEVNAYLQEKGLNVAYPIPEGTEFQYQHDDDYDTYDVYVTGGSSTAYMSALETAGFTKYDDAFDEYGCYYFIKDGLNIDVYTYDVDLDADYYYISFYPAE